MNHSPQSLLEPLEPRLAPAGVILLSTAGGGLTLTGDIANNSVQVAEIAPGTWEVTDHLADGTLFSLNGGAAAPSVTLFATQSLKAKLNGGDDNIRLADLEINGHVNILGNDGIDGLTMSGTAVNGTTTFDGGTGNDAASLAGDFNGLLALKLGTGNDGVTFGDTFLGRGLVADLGADSNSFSITGSDFQCFGPVTIAATATAVDTQTFSLSPTSGFIAGNLTLKATNGTNSITLGGGVAGDSFEVSGNVVIATGAGIDSFILQQNLQIAGGLAINAGNGTNTLTSDDLADFRLGSLTFAGGTGDDSFTLKGDAGIIGGALSFTGGAGVNEVDLAPTSGLRIGGALNYTGGAGDDTLNISGNFAAVGGQLAFKGGDGSNTLAITVVIGSLSSVSYTGGKSDDGLQIGDATNLTTGITVRGNVTSSLGAAGGRVDIFDTLVYGGVNLSSANTQLMGFEFVNITESTVLGASAFKMEGAADATITLNDVTFQSALTISTGGGADRVNFDTDEVDTAVFSVFNTTVKINLGAGDDFFNAGTLNMVATVGNQFSGLELDGGAGNDTAEFEDAPYQNTFLNPAVIKNVETKS